VSRIRIVTPVTDTFDIVVIGGGINGAGIARDAAGRGWSVALFEMNDLASGTSSWSTKLIHGGLRYLEYYEFRLVREALREREVLWAIAPHIVHPLRFVLPHHPGLRPRWLLRLGLFLYDHLGGRKRLPPTASLDLTRDKAGAPLRPGLFARGFEYSDCFVDDARLVVLNARDAARRGALVRTRCEVVAARRDADGWEVEVCDRAAGATRTVRARVLVNAAGPWVAKVLGGALGVAPKAKVRLVQGSHIVVRRLVDHDRAYIFQTKDERIVFAIPYERDFTLIGTTDRDYTGDPALAAASDGEIDYLLAEIGGYFRRAIGREDIVWTYSGVRPLYDDGASEARAATRDYVLEVEAKDGAPVLSVFGGKITTYRRLALEALEALERIAPALPPATGEAPGWTGEQPLPGGAFGIGEGPALAARLRSRHPFLGEDQAARLIRAYGTDAFAMLEGAASPADLGRDFGAGLSEREVAWLMDNEWARTADDVVWRRSKLGLRLDARQIEALDAVMRARLAQLPETMRNPA
jgi:glycerol-3-phosphate dehydrogenase